MIKVLHTDEICTIVKVQQGNEVYIQYLTNDDGLFKRLQEVYTEWIDIEENWLLDGQEFKYCLTKVLPC